MVLLPKRRRFWILPAVLLLSLLGLEGALRVRQYIKHGTLGSVHEFVEHEGTGLPTPPAGKVTRTMSIDSLGFRNPELAQPKPDGRRRLAFLGGSTTFCAETSSNASTWPALVAAGLAERGSQDIDYVNAGVPGYVVASSLDNYDVRVAPMEPDVVFIYHAYNDLVKDSRQLAVAAGREEAASHVDWLGDYSLLWHLVRQNVLVARQVKQVQAAAPIEVDSAALADAFAGRLEALVHRIQADGVEPVLITFCFRGRDEQDPAKLAEALRSASRYMPYLGPADVVRCLKAYNEAIRSVAQETGVRLLECADAVPDDSEYFNDAIHLLDAGCVELAQSVLEQFEASMSLAGNPPR